MRPNSILCTCQICGTEFRKKASAVARGGGKFCSHACQSEAKRNTVDSIWARVDQSAGPDGCWPWMGYRKPDDYGAVNFGGREWPVHRLIYALVHGDPAPELVIRHTCDVPYCANPAHLLSGTPAENMYERRDRGRYARGEAMPNAKLTEAKVHEIRRLRAEGQTYTDIAARIGASPTAVWLVANGRAWKHVGID